MISKHISESKFIDYIVKCFPALQSLHECSIMKTLNLDDENMMILHFNEALKSCQINEIFFFRICCDSEYSQID